MNLNCDIAVVGSGFAGSLIAMIARKLGRSVALLERDRHPRFAIGESSTPLANLLLEELAARYDLPRVASLSKWGAWQAAHPELPCGLKRGFTFFHHSFDQRWAARPDHSNELLVAASPHDGIADTHWYRADFDQFLALEARRLGVDFLDGVRLEGAEFASDDVLITGAHSGEPLAVRAQFVIDATGPRGFLHRALALPEAAFPSLPATQGLWTHFDGVRRWDALHPQSDPPPYPVDDAAMHHVFDGGWIWELRFNNGITSAGAAVTDALANELRLAEGRRGWERLLDRLPSVREQFEDAETRMPFVHSPRLAHRSAAAAGDRWALLPSAAGFVDPLLSTGFPLTLLGVERLARLIADEWDSTRMATGLREYSAITLRELDGAAELVATLYANMEDFDVFAAVTLLYFAAAMFAETQRRLGLPGTAHTFLLLDHPKFGPALRSCLELARRSPRADPCAVIDSIRRAIDPINLAGLGDPARRNWYPALAEDLLAASSKLGVDRRAVDELLERCGFVLH